MDIQKIRRRRLEGIIAEYGGVKSFSQKTGIHHGQIYRVRDPQPGSHKKSDPLKFTEALARKIEEKTGKPKMWMDGGVEIDLNRIDNNLKTILKAVVTAMQKKQIDENAFYSPEDFYNNMMLLSELFLRDKNTDAEELKMKAALVAPKI